MEKQGIRIRMWYSFIMTKVKSEKGKVVISEKGASFLRKGQRWMYRNNLVDAVNCTDGGLADVVSEAGEYLGTGFYSAVSHIVVRLLTNDSSVEVDEDFFYQRIRDAWNYRKYVEPDNLTNVRVIYGDADSMPGLTVDRYNDVLSAEIICKGFEIRKDMIYRLLLEVLREDGQDVTGVYERNEVKSRMKEGLDLYKGAYNNEMLNLHQTINENGVLMQVDIENGQKTGYFLDQKSNRVLIRNLSSGKKVCDCFTHTGGFALNAAYGNAQSVVAVDVSKTALDQALCNARLNHLEDRITFVQDDVFAYLDTLAEGQFDLIILDPPAFTKSRRTVDHAYQGYKRINQKAMSVLQNGGYLATCSCSRYMENELFEKMLKEAAQEENVSLRCVSVSYQNKDHPVLEAMPSTLYLKFYIYQVVSNG